MSFLAIPLAMAKHLPASKLGQACTNKAILMVAIAISSHGNDSQQALQPLGNRIVLSVTTIALATRVALQLLHGQAAIEMATVTLDMVALLEAVLLHGSNRHLLLHPSVNLAMAMVATQEAMVITTQDMGHHRRQHHQV